MGFLVEMVCGQLTHSTYFDYYTVRATIGSTFHQTDGLNYPQ